MNIQKCFRSLLVSYYWCKVNNVQYVYTQKLYYQNEGEF